jgi:hypothetical protein
MTSMQGIAVLVPLIRRNGRIADQTFEIYFLDPAAPAYATLSANGADQ